MGVHIGIIVPVHNTGKYLKECIDSILKQTFNNFEILLINDGSTDNSQEICNHYSELDSRISVVSLDGLGVSNSRNVGLNYFHQKEYITHISFIDSDDCVNKDYLSVLLKLLLKTDSDISMCCFERFERQVPNNNVTTYNQNSYRGNDFWLRSFNGGADSVLWNKLYKKDVLTGIVFPVGKIHEDEFALHHIIGNTKQICSCDAVLYYYRKRQGSIMDDSKSQKSENDLVDAFIDRIIYFQKHNLSKTIKFNTYTTILNYLNHCNSRNVIIKRKEIRNLYHYDKDCFTLKQRIIIRMKMFKKISNFLWPQKNNKQQ